MRLLFVADGRSPTALNWIRYFIDRGDEVHLASTFACTLDMNLAGFELIPVAFSGIKSGDVKPIGKTKQKSRLWGSSTLQLRTVIRQWLGPLTISRAASRLRGMIERTKPDLVHAMRIPYEGMMSADAAGLAPLLVSVWGNDFTLHAASTPMMQYYTQWTLKVTDALHADCLRDIRLGRKLGFSPQKPSLVIPGSGGIRAEVFYPDPAAGRNPVVINPRGFRAYVCNEAFFRAIPLVLKERPDARFVCTGMRGESQVLEWIETLGIGSSVELLPALSQAELAEQFRAAQVVVSPTRHDGTPNSLLEAMACGCFPVAGDLDSIREWITPGENGLLVNANNPQALAVGILRGLNEPALRQQAAEVNAAVIAERAEYGRSMAHAAEFYSKLTNSTI